MVSRHFNMQGRRRVPSDISAPEPIGGCGRAVLPKLNGTYVYDAANKELALQFGLIKTKSFVVYDSGNINIVFQSDGVLKILKAVCAASSKSTLSMLGTLLNNYDGLRIGMSFTK